MNRKPLLTLALALAGLSACGIASARGPVDVQWQVTIGGPLGLPLPPVPVIVSRPSVVVNSPAPRHMGYGDRDRDGIPDRYDRRYNPAWDRDGDGIPNRYDRIYNPAWDRDGDGNPNRYDRRDDRAVHGWRGEGRRDGGYHGRRDDRRDDRREPIGRH